MKYVHINKKTNELLGWYSKDYHDKIPKPNVEVTDEVWQEALKVNANYRDPKDGSLIHKDLRTENEKNNAARLVQNKKALKYLSDTDWYVIRYQETGKAIPQDILDARAEARTKIIKEENANTK